MEFKVEGMSCNHCVSTVTKTVKALDPLAEVEVDLASHTVRVETGKEPQEVAKALGEAGYPTSQ